MTDPWADTISAQLWDRENGPEHHRPADLRECTAVSLCALFRSSPDGKTKFRRSASAKSWPSLAGSTSDVSASAA